MFIPIEVYIWIRLEGTRTARFCHVKMPNTVRIISLTLHPIIVIIGRSTYAVT